MYIYGIVYGHAAVLKSPEYLGIISSLDTEILRNIHT